MRISSAGSDLISHIIRAAQNVYVDWIAQLVNENYPDVIGTDLANGQG